MDDYILCHEHPEKLTKWDHAISMAAAQGNCVCELSLLTDTDPWTVARHYNVDGRQASLSSDASKVIVKWET